MAFLTDWHHLNSPPLSLPFACIFLSVTPATKARLVIFGFLRALAVCGFCGYLCTHPHPSLLPLLSLSLSISLSLSLYLK